MKINFSLSNVNTVAFPSNRDFYFNKRSSMTKKIFYIRLTDAILKQDIRICDA